MHEWDHPHVIFPLFAPPTGVADPIRGEKTRADPGYARMQNMAWIGPRVAEKSLTNKQTYSKTNTSPFALTSEWRVKSKLNITPNATLYGEMMQH